MSVTKVNVKKTVFHSSGFAARDLMVFHYKKAGITTEVQLPEDTRFLYSPKAR